MNIIYDAFTAMNVSRQRKWQLRQQAAGQCTICGKPTASTSRCLHHLVNQRERQRARLGTRTRYANARSYRLEHAN